MKYGNLGVICEADRRDAASQRCFNQYVLLPATWTPDIICFQRRSFVTSANNSTDSNALSSQAIKSCDKCMFIKNVSGWDLFSDLSAF